MFHPENTSAITTVKAPNETMTLFVARDGSYLSVNGWKGDKAQVNIYSLNGQCVLAISNWTGSNTTSSSS